MTALPAVAACEVPGVPLVQPDVGTDEGTGVAIHVAMEHSALATAIGWSARVPEPPG